MPGPAARPRRERALGAAGLAALLLAAVPLAAPGPGLVPAAGPGSPAWLLGPYSGGLGVGAGVYYACLWLAFAAYLCVVVAAPRLGRRLLVGSSLVLIAGFALAPPLLSADVLSYIDYARLGVAHGLNPYTHGPAAVPADPAFPYVGWRESPSAYGPLFTLLSYPLAWLSVASALWTLKALAAASVLALALLVARMAASRGVDPKRAFALVALNPLVLVHVVGGAHNDGLMALLVTAACAGVLGLRERGGGVALVSACAIKVSAAFAAPFALLGAGKRSSRLLLGAGLALAAIAIASVAAFGSHGLDSIDLAGDNQEKVSSFSIPNLLSELLNLPIGDVRTAALIAYALLIAALLRRVWRGGDWLRATGWAAFGLLIASAWLLPWYVVWVLPFAALARDERLIAAVLALTALQLAARIPL